MPLLAARKHVLSCDVELRPVGNRVLYWPEPLPLLWRRYPDKWILVLGARSTVPEPALPE